MSEQNSAAVSHGSHHKQDASFARSKGGLIKQNNQTLIGIGENTETLKKKNYLKKHDSKYVQDLISDDKDNKKTEIRPHTNPRLHFKKYFSPGMINA